MVGLVALMSGWFAEGHGATPVAVVSVDASLAEIAFETTPASEVAGALADLRAGAFDSAARRLGALVDAGGGVDVRYAHAVALYEAGDLGLADAATVAALRVAPSHAPLQSLRGLVLADLGRGTDALAALDAAAAAARGQGALTARIELNRALVHLDRGDPSAAEAALDRARPLAASAADPDLVARIDAMRSEVAAQRGTGSGTDPLSQVGDLLARGDVAAAKGALPTAPATDRRSRLRAAIASAAIARAEGKFDQAQRILEATASEAAEHGLLREEAAADAQLGVVLGASNRPELAAAVLERAIARITGTSFRVAERAYRIEAGRMSLRAGDVRGAEVQIASAAALPGDPSSSASLSELRGALAAARGQSGAASSAYAEATSAFEAQGAWMDAARVGCLAVELHAGADAAATTAARTRALGAFSRAGDPLGPVHVDIADGLGRTAKGDVDGALAAFGSAAKAASAVHTANGDRLARLAKENAAKAVASLTDSAAVLEKSEQWDIEDLVARTATYNRARTAYDGALARYDAGDFDAAQAGFDAAAKDLDAIGEVAYARAARRGRAWAQFNAWTHAEAASGFPVWQRLVEEGSMLGDAELRVRAMGAVALAAAELERPEAPKSLAAAAAAAESMGLRSLAGQCHASLVEVAPALADKVAAARRAFALRDGDALGVYALYSASVAAYEAEAYDTAIELASQAEPLAGPDVAPSVREVLAAARAAR